MSITEQLLTEIEAYVAQRGIAELTFGFMAVNDGKFVGRLRSGKGVTVRLVERARKYIADNPADTPTRASA